MFDKLHAVTLADLVQMLEVLENQHLDALNELKVLFPPYASVKDQIPKDWFPLPNQVFGWPNSVACQEKLPEII